MPPPSSFTGALPIPALGQQSLPQGLSPAGPYTALLGPQMQPLLPPGVLQPGQYPAGFAGLPHASHMHHLALLPKKRQSTFFHQGHFKLLASNFWDGCLDCLLLASKIPQILTVEAATDLSRPRNAKNHAPQLTGLAGSSHAAELADLPEIPLRRRGRPAGDGATAAASPHELQERRMQANRAAASRSHFR